VTYKTPPQTASFSADYVVEWSVENDPDRYKRLSTVGVPTRDEVTYDRRGKKRTEKIPTHAVVLVALEVPLPELEKVTSQLKASRLVRPMAPVLQLMIESASGATEWRDRCAKLEKEVRDLQLLAVSKACMIDAHEVGIARACDLTDDEHLWSRCGVSVSNPGAKLLGIRNQEETKKEINLITVGSCNYIKQVRTALDEKRADVAARLLAALPEGDF